MGSKSLKERITLSPFGRNKEIEKIPEQVSSKVEMAEPSPPVPPPKFDWGNALIDGAIIAGLTFFTTLGGVGALGANLTNTVASGAISATAQFFLMLAIKRGLRRAE
jgi:hypothetical protein